jgi:gluconokinase
MRSGIPLTDADRWDWLIILREEAITRLQHSDGVVVTCSALRHRYRDVIRVANYGHPSIHIHFIYLSASEELLLQRVGARQGHYMHSNMVHSQMMSLEPPDSDEENNDVITVDCSGPTDEVQEMALEAVREKLEEDP